MGDSYSNAVGSSAAWMIATSTNDEGRWPTCTINVRVTEIGGIYVSSYIKKKISSTIINLEISLVYPNDRGQD